MGEPSWEQNIVEQVSNLPPGYTSQHLMTFAADRARRNEEKQDAEPLMVDWAFDPFNEANVKRLADSLVGHLVIGIRWSDSGTLTLVFESGLEFEISDPVGSHVHEAEKLVITFYQELPIFDVDGVLLNPATVGE